MTANVESEILWPTQVRRRLNDGVCVGVDRSVWLVRAIPMSPVVDANSEAEALHAATPLYRALGEIAEVTAIGPVKRRKAVRGAYRNVHILLVNIPRPFDPPRDHPNYAYLREQFGRQLIQDRVLLMAVQLREKAASSGGLRSVVDYVSETLVTGQVPMSAYDRDHEVIASALARAGLSVPTDDQMRTAERWWTLGDFPDVPSVACSDHMHFFDSPTAARAAANAGLDDCERWPSGGSHTVTFASVADFRLPFVSPVSPTAQWVTPLLNHRALAVSIRGRVEPGEVTRDELKRQSKRYLDDITERANNNKSSDITQEEMHANLSDLRDRYSGMGAPPILTEASVLVAFDGYVDVDNTRINPATDLRAMTYRHQAALSETMLCSPVRANPFLHDLPAESIACSGIVSKTAVGDKTGILLGFTELDRQPAWWDTAETGRLSMPPSAIVAGSSGSGKTQSLLHMATQISRSGRPCVILDPKSNSDHSKVVQAAGGQVASLDNLISADGAFDPIRFMERPEDGIQMASSILSGINVWGSKRQDYEASISVALRYGVENGATCTGQALALALDADHIDGAVVKPVLAQADANPMMRACVGQDPDAKFRLRFDGLTLVKVGNLSLELPDIGVPLAQASLDQRIGASLVRLLIYGSAAAVSGRGGGALLVDEAWVFLQSGLSELARLARLARSQDVMPVLFTQKISDALGADFEQHISRLLLLHMDSEKEARAACELAQMEPTPERIGRFLARAEKTEGGGTVENWDSLQALIGPDGRAKRGSVGFYSDVRRRNVPVEIKLSDDFLRMSSTRPEDIARRKAEAAAARPA